MEYLHLDVYKRQHKDNPLELLDNKKRYLVGAGINTRDYATRIPALLEAGADAVSYTHLDVYKRQGIFNIGFLHFVHQIGLCNDSCRRNFSVL